MQFAFDRTSRSDSCRRPLDAKRHYPLWRQTGEIGSIAPSVFERLANDGQRRDPAGL